jgi:hypothetical protein
MGDVMDKKSSRMKVDTYGSYQCVKYAFRAQQKTAVETFARKDILKDPVDTVLCKNIRSSSAVYRKHLLELKEERERKDMLLKIKAKSESKRAAKLALEEKSKVSRAKHILREKKKARIRVLQELAEKLKRKQ